MITFRVAVFGGDVWRIKADGYHITEGHLTLFRSSTGFLTVAPGRWFYVCEEENYVRADVPSQSGSVARKSSFLVDPGVRGNPV